MIESAKQGSFEGIVAQETDVTRKLDDAYNAVLLKAIKIRTDRAEAINPQPHINRASVLLLAIRNIITYLVQFGILQKVAASQLLQIAQRPPARPKNKYRLGHMAIGVRHSRALVLSASALSIACCFAEAGVGADGGRRADRTDRTAEAGEAQTGQAAGTAGTGAFAPVLNANAQAGTRRCSRSIPSRSRHRRPKSAPSMRWRRSRW